MTERNLYLKGGYDKIVNWVAKPLLKDPETIKMGEVVKNIQWGDDDNSVIVETLKGDKRSTFKADAIVVTAPLGCLRRKMINFEPAIPEDIQNGIDAFSFGALGKVFVEFDEVFWPKDNDQFIYYPSPLAEDTPVDE